MPAKGLFFIFSFFLFVSCNSSQDKNKSGSDSILRFEKISYFKAENGAAINSPYKFRLTYYFDNGLPHRWMELDSAGNTLIDYVYEYDSLWRQTSALYLEPGEISYSKEIVTYKNDTTKITEWPDSKGVVYYTMIDDLNKYGKTYRATFIGDTIHGYDSTFYTPLGLEKRIFFTNNKGKIFNDRAFKYDSLNTRKDWIIRNKIMNDTIAEIQHRELHYNDLFINNDGLFYEGIISNASEDENVISFTKNEELVFFTRSIDWIHQKGYLAARKNGLYTFPEPVQGLDSIYNGAISPKGDKIIYCTREEDIEEIWLINMVADSWSIPINLSENSGIQGGYFNWYNDHELLLYMDYYQGDIVHVQLKNDRLEITDSLPQINTTMATEFSPFIRASKKYILFTRYLEGDITQQGIFTTKNVGTQEYPKWGKPKKIESLPYGWNAFVLEGEQLFIYSDGKDIYGVPLDSLSMD